jgi:hypothetical protein
MPQTPSQNDQGAASTGTTGGNHNAEPDSPTPPAGLDEAQLKPDFRDGLAALRERRPEATPVSTRGNDVLVWLGRFNLTERPPDYDQSQTEGYYLLSEDFPHDDPHWFLTAPALTIDGDDIDAVSDRNTFDATHDKHGAKVERVAEVSDKETARAWSWRWSHMNLDSSTPEDMAWAVLAAESALNGGDAL